MSEVPRVRTPLSVEAAAAELLAALRRAGEQPNGDEARLLLAQLWLETGRGACDNHNPGNLTAGNTAEFFRPRWYLPDDPTDAHMVALHAAMLAGQAPNAFASYATFEHGFDDYVRQLKSHFPSILEAARAGDAGGVAVAIRTSGYTPLMRGQSNQDAAVAKNLAALAREFKQRGVFVDLPLVAAAAAAASSPASPC